MSASPQRLPASPKLHVALLVALVVLIGASVSLVVYRFARGSEAARIESEFSHRADVESALARRTLEYNETGSFALKSLFEGSGDVSRDEFRRVATDILRRNPAIAALEWVPIVAADARAAVEARVSRELHRPFQFTEARSDGAMVRARTLPENLPVLYIEPLAGNERALGLDVQSAPSFVHLVRARTSREFTATEQFDLVQGGHGMVMAWPVFSDGEGPDDQRPCSGFVQSVVRTDQMLAQAHLHSPTAALDMLYVDLDATDPRHRILYARESSEPGSGNEGLSEADFRSVTHREYPLVVGGRRWLALYRPTSVWLAQQRTRQPELWLLCGLLLTSLLAAYLTSLLRQAAAIQRQVAERTAELTESRRQLSNLLHTIPGMACRCTVVGSRVELQYVSEGAIALTGYRPEEFLSREIRVRQLLHPADVEHARALLKAGLEGGTDVEAEFRIRTRSGDEKWVLARGRGAYSAEGQPQFFDGLAIDVTGRKQAEAEKIAIEHRLLESQKLESLGLLAGGIAHDFNNLLTGIMGHASLASCGPQLDPAVAEHLRKIEVGSTRAAELCQQMLAYSGRGHFVVQPVDLNDLVRETLPLLQGSLVRARLQLRLTPDPMMVRGDATQLRQVIMNLLLNAADALPPTGGEVAVTTSLRPLTMEFLRRARLGDVLAEGPYVLMEVRDTGCGMDAATMARIFDPFFTTKFAGRGLGLAAVLGIVRGHNGALDVESEPGRGTLFTLILPPTAEKSERAAPASATTPWKRSARVLVIDDEEPVREVAGQLIQSFGMDVITVADGTEGVRVFRENSSTIDLVLLDLTMPGLDGMQTLQALREIVPAVRVLLASGYSEGERVSRMEHGGPLVFLQKPYTRGQLEQKLREVFV